MNFLLLFLLVIPIVVGFAPIFAEDGDISIIAEKKSYTYGDILSLSVKPPYSYESSDIQITIYDPNNRQIYSEKITGSDIITYQIHGTLWQKLGTYNVEANIYGNITGTISFELEKIKLEIKKEDNSEIISEPILLSVSTNKKLYQYSDSITISDASSTSTLPLIANPFPDERDFFGFAVSGVGDTILVGTPFEDLVEFPEITSSNDAESLTLSDVISNQFDLIPNVYAQNL